MSSPQRFLDVEPIYWWSEPTTARVYEHAERWGTAPDVHVALDLRRPSIFARKTLIVAAYRDGLAFRLGESGPFVLRTPRVLWGFTPIPGGMWERWEHAFHRAWTLARVETK